MLTFGQSRNEVIVIVDTFDQIEITIRGKHIP
jgi:hypothetical protein